MNPDGPSVQTAAADVRLTVDGVDYTLAPGTNPSTPLLQVLRWQLGRLGVRPGCGHGVCGACTVLDGDRAVRSCITALDDVTGPVTTAQGLSDGPVVAAFLRSEAGQCAYCINGMIVTVEAARRAAAGPSDLLDALDEHTCRCGAQPRVIAAAADSLGYGRP